MSDSVSQVVRYRLKTSRPRHLVNERPREDLPTFLQVCTGILDFCMG